MTRTLKPLFLLKWNEIFCFQILSLNRCGTAKSTKTLSFYLFFPQNSDWKITRFIEKKINSSILFKTLFVKKTLLQTLFVLKTFKNCQIITYFWQVNAAKSMHELRQAATEPILTSLLNSFIVSISKWHWNQWHNDTNTFALVLALVCAHSFNVNSLQTGR